MGEEVLEEWKMLRGEIARKQSFVEKLVIACAGANFAILSLAFTNSSIEGIFICLLPVVVTGVCYMMVLSYMFSGFRIAKYIKDKLEPQLANIGWETWLGEYRREKRRPVNEYAIFYWSFYIITLVSCMLKFFIIKEVEIAAFGRINLIIVVTGFWILWTVVFHFMVFRRLHGSIKEVFVSPNEF